VVSYLIDVFWILYDIGKLGLMFSAYHMNKRYLRHFGKIKKK